MENIKNLITKRIAPATLLSFFVLSLVFPFSLAAQTAEQDAANATAAYEAEFGPVFITEQEVLQQTSGAFQDSNGSQAFGEGFSGPGGSAPAFSTQGPTQTQAQQYVDGLGASEVTQAQAEYGAIVGQFGECAISNILARAISNAIQNAVKKGTIAIVAAFGIPVSDYAGTYTETRQLDQTSLLRSKEVAAIELFGVPILPSWDALGYCLINTIIEYISESTIRWINGGFQGNPVFVDNFGQFFKDLADIETATFLEELSAPDFLCEPYRIQIQTGLLSSYTDPYYQPKYRGRLGTGRVSGYGKCSFSEASISLEAYVSGSPSSFQQGGWDSWYQLTQNPQNNIYGSYLLAEREQYSRVASRQGEADLEIKINDGFLSFKDEKGRITTPGKIIQGQIENRLNIPENRLVLAREFDEVVNALVNQLVKVALNEVLGGVNGLLGN